MTDNTDTTTRGNHEMTTTGTGQGTGAATAPGLATAAKEYGEKIADAATTAKDYVADKAAVVTDKIKDLSNKDFEILYENNQLTFFAGYNCYENKNAVEFSYYIEGSDDEDYGNWSTQNIIKTTE